MDITSKVEELGIIKKHIMQLKKELVELRSMSYTKGGIVELPSGGKISDKTGSLAVKIRRLEERLEFKLNMLYDTRMEIEGYIDGIEDEETALIFRLRCINGMNWTEIATELIELDGNGEIVRAPHRTTIQKKFDNFIRNSHISH